MSRESRPHPSPAMAELDIPLSDAFDLCPGKRAAGKCIVRGCSRKARLAGAQLCGSHHSRLWRMRNPMRNAYVTLRDHAKARRKEFTLTFEQFSEICSATGYHLGKGVRADDLVLDRIDHRIGYRLDNLRVITSAENNAKGHLEGRVNLGCGTALQLLIVSAREWEERQHDSLSRFVPYLPPLSPVEQETQVLQSDAAEDDEDDLPEWLLEPAHPDDCPF